MSGLLSDLGNITLITQQNEILASVGGALGIGGQSGAAKAKSAAQQQAYNDQVTKAEEEIRAETNLTEQEKANRVAEGTQRVAIAGSGFAVGIGSPLDAQVAQSAADTFKDNVAVFNGLVNMTADQANASNAQAAGAAASATANANAAASDAGLVASIISFL